MADDFCSKLVETDVLARLFGMLESQDSDIQRLSVNAITTFAEFGEFLYPFCTV